MTVQNGIESGALGILSGIPKPLEDIDLKCPVCQSITPNKEWEPWYPPSSINGSPQGNFVRGDGKDVVMEDDAEQHELAIDSITCAEQTCGQVVVRFHETRYKIEKRNEYGVPTLGESTTVTRMLYPHGLSRSLDALVPDPYRKDYIESTTILEASPRASALLSRRIIEHLLEDFDGAPRDKRLPFKIDRFRENAAHPSKLKENLHDVREMGDTVAHPKHDLVTDELIDVTHDEADWTLDVVDRLFDYFIIGPVRTKAIEKAMDEKMRRTNRKAIKRGDSSGTIKP